MRFRFPMAATALLIGFAAGPRTARAATATITVATSSVGVTPTYVGYNYGHYLPGSNTTAWVRRSGINCFRIWAAPSYYEPSDDLAPYGDGVVDPATFELRKAALRADPENPAFINWNAFESRYETVVQPGRNSAKVNHMLGEMRRLGVPVMAVISRTAWTAPGTWGDRWEHWQHYYAAAYHMARRYDVEMFETFNEPDHSSNDMSLVEHAEWLRFASDAVRSALADVNARYGKSLRARVLAPTITHASETRGPYHMDADPDSDPRDNQFGWGQYSLLGLRTDYRGQTVPYDIFDIFATHKYGRAGDDFEVEMAMMNTKMRAYTPTGVALPVFYTEFNRHGSTAWATNYPSVSLDTPDIFADIGDILARSARAGVYGLIAFKFSATDYSPYGPQKTGFHHVSDTAPCDIGGALKGADVVRLYCAGFTGARELLSLSASASATGLVAVASRDTTASLLRIFTANRSASSFDTTFQLSAFANLQPGSPVTVEEVSATRQGEVASVAAVSAGRSFTVTQPGDSVLLLTVPLGTPPQETAVAASADAQVQGGSSATTNYGTDPVMQVRLGSTEDLHRVSYLKFPLPGLPSGTTITRALLEVTGSNPIDAVPLTCHVYGLGNDSWNESTLVWNGAPDLDTSQPRLRNVGTATGPEPLGHLSFGPVQQAQRVDVTPFVLAQAAPAADHVAGFVIAREAKFATDTADTPRHAGINTREAADGRPTLRLWTTTLPRSGVTGWELFEP